jgi:hypothetical protein
MKTAKQYLFDVMGCEPVMSRIDYADALEAVQAALDDAGSVREQAQQALTDYFNTVLPEPAPQVLPLDTPPIRLSERLRQAGCFRCGQQHCDCEQPPF